MAGRRTLAIELALAIARDLRARLAHDCERPGNVFHGFQGPFDTCCYTLWKMGAAVAVIGAEADESYLEFTEEVACNAGTFRVRPDAEIVSQIDRRPDLAEPDLDPLVTAYLSLMCDYCGLPSSRDWFVPEQAFVPTLDALAASGYAARLGGQYRWSAAIAPHMHAAHVWDAAARPLDEVEAEDRRAFLSSLPPALRDELVETALSAQSELLFYRWFRDRFADRLSRGDAGPGFARAMRAMIQSGL